METKILEVRKEYRFKRKELLIMLGINGETLIGIDDVGDLNNNNIIITTELEGGN